MYALSKFDTSSVHGGLGFRLGGHVWLKINLKHLDVGSDYFEINSVLYSEVDY